MGIKVVIMLKLVLIILEQMILYVQVSICRRLSL